jgi:3-hydroxyisobutyrate dehydrogenase
MGSGVLGRLSQSGAVAAFDSDHGRREAVSRAGGTWMDSVAAVAQVSEVFITVLPGPDEADAVMNEAFHALTSGALWLDLTSGDPVRVAELTAKAADRGIDAVAAPMGGGPADAAAGTLVFYVGGSSDPVARAEAILRQLSAEGGIRMCGPNPSDGHTVKLLANALWFANALAATEALLIGQAQGLAPQQLQALLADSAGSSTALSQHLPRLFEGDYLASFGIDRVVEELGTVAALARSSSTTSRLLDASAGVHREALARFGPVPGELLGARVIEELAGRYLR